MLKDKILFIFKRYKYNDNKILTSEDLSFLSIISSNAIIRSFKFTVKNILNENDFDINFSKNIEKRLISTFKSI